MKKIILLSLSSLVIFLAPQAEALSCLPVDVYLEGVVGDDATQVFIGTATEVENHTQVVTVNESLQGWVAAELFVVHQYSDDWKYFCSNGPAVVGRETIFLTMVDQNSTRLVTQTLAADSKEGRDLIKMIKEEKVDAGITGATPAERASELRYSIIELIKVLVNMLLELKHLEGKA